MVESNWRARLYESYVSSGQGGAGAEAMFVKQKSMYTHLIKSHVPEDRSIRVLDLGCGAGGLLYFLKRSGFKNIQGVDLSAEMIGLAHRSGVIEAQIGNLFDTLNDCADCAIDLVFALDILEHLDRAELFELCQQVYRVLSPNGRFITHVPNAGGIFGNIIRYGDLTHELAFTESSLRQLMRTVGFKSIDCYEDKPRPHGVKSAVRAALWALMSLPFRILYAAETGKLKSILSQNMTVVAYCKKEII